MASESEMASILDQLLRDDTDDGLFPILMVTAGPPPAAGETEPPPPDLIVLIDPLTQAVVVVQVETAQILLGQSDQSGTPPASKASMKELRTVEAEELKTEQECAVCLDEFDKKKIVKEMPCKHRFHERCVEKWLGMHGSCPVCRFQMPVEETSASNGGEEEQRMRETVMELLLTIFVEFLDGEVGGAGP